MILTAILLGAATLVGGGLLVSFWNSLIDWLKRAVRKVSTIISGTIYGTKVFVKKVGSMIQEISKHYSKKTNKQWVEHITTREVPPSQVPQEILNKAKIVIETDITSQLQMEL